MDPMQAEQALTSKFFYKTFKIVYHFGAHNFWCEELSLNKNYKKMNGYLWTFSKFLITLLIFSELGSIATQKNLTEKQIKDLTLFSVSHPFLFLFVLSTHFRKNEIRELWFKLMELKTKYYDVDVEKSMIRKVKMYTIFFGLLFSVAVISYGLDAVSQMITAGATFTTVITAWPDVNDHSTLATILRIPIFIVFLTFITLTITVYIILLSLVICISFQYKTLQSYFFSLNGIFENGTLNQEEKEQLFERKLKEGIKMHSEILACTSQCQKLCNFVFIGHITMNTIFGGLVLAQMVSPNGRSLARVMTSGVTVASFLLSTGLIMWSVGDITVEASFLPNAMFASGWQHCVKSSRKVRTLLMIAMVRSSKPVLFQCFGFIDLTYSSYVTIVKTSYSLFSVLY